MFKKSTILFNDLLVFFLYNILFDELFSTPSCAIEVYN
jgi:hypothetical protein